MRGTRGKAAEFKKNLPILLKIYRSWKVDDRVFQARLAKAVKSLKETYRIIHDAGANRQRTVSRAVDDWSEYIRGTAIVYDSQCQEFSETPNTHVERMVERLNEQDGFRRWVIVPLKDLNNP